MMTQIALSALGPELKSQMQIHDSINSVHMTYLWEGRIMIQKSFKYIEIMWTPEHVPISYGRGDLFLLVHAFVFCLPRVLFGLWELL